MIFGYVKNYEYYMVDSEDFLNGIETGNFIGLNHLNYSFSFLLRDSDEAKFLFQQNNVVYF